MTRLRIAERRVLDTLVWRIHAVKRFRGV